MRLQISVAFCLLIAIAVRAQEGDLKLSSRLRGRGRGPRILSSKRLAQVIDEAVSIEEGEEEGRKRVILRKPGGAFRRVKLIRRPRPSFRVTSPPSTVEPTKTPPIFTTPKPVTLSSTQPTFQFTTPFDFTTTPAATSRPQRPAKLQTQARNIPRVVPTFRRPAFETSPIRSFDNENVSNGNQHEVELRQFNRQEEVVGTIKNYSYNNEDGSFTFGYEAEDGSFKEETRGADCVVRGKYGYIDPDGVKREFTYESGNPCTPGEEEEESVIFDEQGFPILEEEGPLSEIDPLDDQPIRINPNQFISQTKEEVLTENELRQFRRPKSFKHRPEVNSLRNTVKNTPIRVEAENVEKPRFIRPPRPTVPFQTTQRTPVTFRPPSQTTQRTPVTFRPPSQTTQLKPATFRPPSRSTPRTPVTFRPPPQTFRKVHNTPFVSSNFDVQPKEKPEINFESKPNNRPFIFFGTTNRPKLFHERPESPSNINFEKELREINNFPTTVSSLDSNDKDFSLTQKAKKTGGSFNHELVFDRNAGKHHHKLVQKLPEGTEVRIGETLKSFPKPVSSTTPPNFRNSFFQSHNTRFNTPPPTTRKPFSVSHRPEFPSEINSATRRPDFDKPVHIPPSFPPKQLPQNHRPTVFSVFNEPNRPSPAHFNTNGQINELGPHHGSPPRIPAPLGGDSFFRQPTPQGTPGQHRTPFNIFNREPRPIQKGNTAFSVFNRSPRPSAVDNGDGDERRPPVGGVRPIQQISFGTQVDKPVFSQFGAPQPFQPTFGRPPPSARFQQPQIGQPGHFQPPQPVNFFST